MAEKTLSGKILLRNDTATNWTTVNPVLSKGEIGIEIDTNKFKIGDGIKTWSQLTYIGTTVTASATNGNITVDGVEVNVYTLPNNIPVLDANGKLPTSTIPAIAITDVLTASSEADMLALTAQKGDMCVRTDTNAVYILSTDDPTVLANWVQINVPYGGVSSVNGQTGVVVLTTDDITEGSNNEYFTAARFNTAFSGKASTDLTDGASILHSSDTLIINCGNA